MYVCMYVYIHTRPVNTTDPKSCSETAATLLSLIVIAYHGDHTEPSISS